MFAHWLFNMPLTTEEEIDPAEEVRKFPALYDKKNSQYHEREVVRNCWREYLRRRLHFAIIFKANNNRNRLLKTAIFLKIKHQVNSLLCFYLPQKGPGIDQTALMQGVKVVLTMYPPNLNFYRKRSFRQI